jgi:ATP-dependent helicase/nuclease subunit A
MRRKPEAAKQAAIEEEKRLLYVAMTRARDRLYIAGWLQKGLSDAPADSWYALAAAALSDTQRQSLAAGEQPLAAQKETSETPPDRETETPFEVPVETPFKTGASPDWVSQGSPAKQCRSCLFG